MEPNAAPTPQVEIPIRIADVSPGSAPPLPGIASMAAGIDILSYDSYAPGLSAAGTVFAYEYNETASVGGVSYAYPGILNFSDVDSVQFRAQSQQLFSAYDIQRSISASVSVSGTDPEAGFYFSASGSYQQTEEQTGSFDSVVSLSSAVVLLWTLTQREGAQVPLSQEFAEAVAGLPAEYDQDTYQAFLTTSGFGTHYIAAATFGGRAFQNFQMTVEQASTLWSDKIDASVEAGVYLAANVGASVSSSSKSFQEFKDTVAMSQVQYLGGQSFGSFTTWAPTVQAQPEIVCVTLNPISELLTPAYFPKLDNIEQIQANLVTAYQSYLQTGSNPSAGALQTKAWALTYSPPFFNVQSWSPTGGGKYLSLNKEPNFVGLEDSPPLPFAFVNHSGTASGPVPANQDVYLAWAGVSYVGPEHFPSCLELDDSGNLVVSETDGPPGSKEAWQLVVAFAGAGGAPPQSCPTQSAPPQPLVFAGAVYQLYNARTGAYLKAHGSEVIHTTDAVDPATLWTLVPTNSAG